MPTHNCSTIVPWRTPQYLILLQGNESNTSVLENRNPCTPPHYRVGTDTRLVLIGFQFFSTPCETLEQKRLNITSFERLLLEIGAISGLN